MPPAPLPSPAPEPLPATLRDAMAVIPASCLEKSNSRAWLLVARDVTLWLASVVALAFTDRWFLVLPLWVLAGLSVAAMFVLAHDAAHQALFSGRKTNDRVARWLMIPSQHIRASWALGHNHIHHRYTAREGMDFVWHPVTRERYEASGRLGKLAHRIEWSCLGAGAYYMRVVWWQQMVRLTEPPAKWTERIQSDRRWLARLTVLLIGAVGATGWVRYGTVPGAGWMIVKLLVVPFLLFTWAIGFTVYVHHISTDLPWASRRGWTKVRGQLESTTILKLPWLARPFFHSIFVHVPHHVDPRIPCYHLDEAAQHLAAAYPSHVGWERLTMRRYLRTTRDCKLYDFDQQSWSGYKAR